MENSPDLCLSTDGTDPISWEGFYMYDRDGFGSDGERHWMSLQLRIVNGDIEGSGSDDVGAFRIRGRLDRKRLAVDLKKSYIGRHELIYRGYYEQSGRIWGNWLTTYSGSFSGYFHIWLISNREDA